MFRSKPRPTESTPNVQEDAMTTTNTPTTDTLTVTELHAEIVAEGIAPNLARHGLAGELAEHVVRDDVGRLVVPRIVAADVLARYRAAAEAQDAEARRKAAEAARVAAERQRRRRVEPSTLRNRYRQAVAEEESAEADLQMTRAILAGGEPKWEDPAVWQARRASEEASLPALRRRLEDARQAVDDARRALRDNDVDELAVDTLRVALDSRGHVNPLTLGADR